MPQKGYNIGAISSDHLYNFNWFYQQSVEIIIYFEIVIFIFFNTRTYRYIVIEMELFQYQGLHENGYCCMKNKIHLYPDRDDAYL